jgi:hypothetical protein
MTFPVLQIAGALLVAVYLGRLRVKLRRRNRQSWESLVARLEPSWSLRESSSGFPWKEGLCVTPEEIWDRIQGVRGLWAMYQNARVMLEMADFATRNSDTVDPMLLHTLRSDATQIRICVLSALTQYSANRAAEGVRVNAFRAASIYTGMTARMAQLLQENAATALPDFVAAM